MTATLGKETVRLTSGDFANEGDARSIRALLFGALLDRATPIQRYRSDLFHDALWIDKNVNGEFVWYWMVRDSGTHIGTDLHDAVAVFGRDGNGTDTQPAYYKITLWQKRAMWVATFEQLPSH